MPANEFEKRIQQRMDELKLAPSGGVWEQVELRIRKEKRRRRVIFWIPLLLVGLGTAIATIVLMNNTKKSSIVQANELNKPKQSQPAFENKDSNAVNTLSPAQNIKEKKPVAENKFNQTTKTPRSKDGLKKSYKTQIKVSSIKNSKNVKSPLVDLVKPVVKERTDAGMKNKKDDKVDKMTYHESVIETNIQSSQQKEISNPDSISILPIGKQIETKIQLQGQSKKDSTVQDSISIAEKKVVKSIKKTKNWQWGISLQKGSSHISDGLRFSNNYVLADNTAANPSNSPGSNIQTSKPSAIQAAGSFGAGIFLQRSIASRLNLSFDAHYLYLSTKMNVGTHVDSSFTYNNSYFSAFSLNTFYRPSGSNSSYTNKYHFAGLSAELSWQIIKDKKFHVDWNNGISYDHLLSSNALFYDKNLPGYYKNSKLLTHDHLFFSTSLSAPVFKKLFINPFAEYSLTLVQKRSVAPKTHFINYGLRLKFLLDKK